MKLLSLLSVQFLALASGFVLSGGIFALIASIGIVPRLADKTGTREYLWFYENSIIAGGIFGALSMAFNLHIPIGRAGLAIFALGIGIFVGSLAVSLVEILDVMPILARRGEIYEGLPWFMLSIAIGKLAGSIIYNLMPGFYFS